MRYFVEFLGQLYGPVGVDALRQWKAEGRVTPDSVLVEEASQRRLPAYEVPGLFEPGAASGPPPVAGLHWGSVPPTGYPGAVPARKGMPVWAILLCIFGGGCVLCGPILAAILFPVFSSARHAALNTAAISNMKELGLASLIYANDYDGAFPPKMATALEAKPYLRADSQAKAPGSDQANDSIFVSMNPSGGVILGDPRLAGKDPESFADPAKVVMFYDERPWPNGRGLACYVDGHAKSQQTFAEVKQALRVDPIPLVKVSKGGAGG